MIRPFLLFAALLLCPAVSLGQSTYLWNVNTGTAAFTTAGNWLVGGSAPVLPPGSSDDCFINIPGTYTVTHNSGTTVVKTLTLDNSTGTLTLGGGSFTVSNSFTFTDGVFNLQGSSANLFLNNGMTMAGGTGNIQNGRTVNLTGTMTLNGGVFTLNNGILNGGAVTGGGNQLRITNGSGTLTGVNIGLDTLDLSVSINLLHLRGGSIFAANSTYTTMGDVFTDGATTPIANVTLNFGRNFTNQHVTPDVNTTLVISNGAALKNTGSSSVLHVGNFTGTNRSVTNFGLIENTVASSSTYLKPTGTVTNNGTILASAGIVDINPINGLILSSNSIIQSTGSAIVIIRTPSVSNSGAITATSGNMNIANTTTATYDVLAGGSTMVNNAAVLTVGNSNSSAINNAGTFTLNSGGQLNLGTNSSPGLFTQTGGSFSLNGTAFSRFTASGGRITGAGTINALNSSGGSPTVVFQSGSILAPGNSPGQITIGGGIEIGGTVEMDITQGIGGNNSNTQGNTTPGSGFDSIRVQPPSTAPNTATNTTIRTATTNFKIFSANTSQTEVADNSGYWSTEKRWAIVRLTINNPGNIEMRDSNDTLLSGQVTTTAMLFNIDGSLQFNPLEGRPNGRFYLEMAPSVIDPSNFRQQLDLVWTPVPEPLSILAFTSFTLLVGWNRHRKRKCNSILA